MVLDDAEPVDPGRAAIIVAAVGLTAVDDEPWFRRLVRPPTGVPVVVSAGLDDDSAALGALHQGAAGYLLADTRGDELVAALTKAAAGHIVIDVTIGGRLTTHLAQGVIRRQPRLDDWHLRPRERQVLEALLDGRSNQEIAEALNLGRETVKTYLRSVYRKLGARDRAQAVATVLRRR